MHDADKQLVTCTYKELTTTCQTSESQRWCLCSMRTTPVARKFCRWALAFLHLSLTKRTEHHWSSVPYNLGSVNIIGKRASCRRRRISRLDVYHGKPTQKQAPDLVDNLHGDQYLWSKTPPRRATSLPPQLMSCTVEPFEQVGADDTTRVWELWSWSKSVAKHKLSGVLILIFEEIFCSLCEVLWLLFESLLLIVIQIFT